MAILDSDDKYAVKLMEFINQMKATLFITSVFSEVTDYLSYKSGHEVDVLLCSEEYIDSLNQGGTKNMIFVLTKSTRENISGYQSIHKYQSAVSIYNKLLELYGGFIKRNEPSLICEDVIVHGIIPVFSKEECFYFGILSADYLGKAKKVLYISFDPLFNPKVMGFAEKSIGITEGICMIKSMSDNIHEHLGGMILHAKNFDIFGGCGHWADCTEIEENDAVNLVEKLIERKEYERIFIDFGGLYRMTGGLIRLCQNLYIPKPHNEYELTRLKTCIRQSGLMGINLKEKAKLVSFNDKGEGEDYLSNHEEAVSRNSLKARLNEVHAKRRNALEEANEVLLIKLRKSSIMNIVKNIDEG